MSKKAGLAVLALAVILAPLALGLGDSDDRPVRIGGLRTIAADTASNADPIPFWGAIDCERDSRVEHPSGAFRRLRVIDGDDLEGERCELGENDRGEGPTVFYREGDRRVTLLSIRLPRDFPLGEEMWQVVMQMKQTQPSENGGGTPVLALEAWDGRWRLRQSESPGPASDSREIWSAPAETVAWIPFAFDVTYSQDPSTGRVRVHADLNGDGDFDDSGERSATIRTYTLKRESEDGDDGLERGESIPSHLRVGVYHHPDYPCPAPAGCYVDVDNVAVLVP